jgi:hypothetical protein
LSMFVCGCVDGWERPNQWNNYVDILKMRADLLYL